ncbi:hypothetical protein ABBQ32_004910 [Trebouxia sp. C0010 RCD-2024]
MSKVKAFGEAEWVSEKTKELDKLGGKNRPPVKRGDSLKMKLQWLEEGLQHTQKIATASLKKDDNNAKWELKQQEKRKHLPKVAPMAFGRRIGEGGEAGPRKALVDSGLSVRSLGLNSARATPDELARSEASSPRSGSQGSRASPTSSAAPSGGSSSPLGPGALSPYNAPMPAGKRQSIVMLRRGSMARKSLMGAQLGLGKGIPQWRQNITRAKTKFRAVMKAMPALKRAIKSKGSNIPRLDSFGLMLESALGTDLERFGDYQTRLVKLNPKLAEGVAPAAPSTNNTPVSAAPVNATSGTVPPADHTDATTPEADAEERAKALNMMRMLANRQNSRWLEAKEWDMPYTFDATKFPTLLGGEEYSKYKQQVVDMLKAGQLVVQMLAAEETISMPDGSRKATFTQETWDMVRWCCPNRLLATGERIDGLSIGGRQLLALRLAVEKLAGSEAVGKMTLLLHLAEEMEEPVLADLRAHNLYGFDRENFIIVPQVRRFGYRFHADGKRFDRVTDSEAWLSGSGYALQQLTWDREAYIMANNYTARSFLPGSVMEHLKAKNVQWMVSGRTADLARCGIEGALEVDCLAYTLKLAQERGANMSCEVKAVEGLIAARQQNSVMVSTKGDTRAQRLPKETCRFGTDLKFADLQSVKSTKWINDFVASSNNQLVVSTDRYIFQMSALVTLLSKGPQGFHADIDLHGQQVYLSFHMADLTAAPQACCAPLLSKLPLLTVRTHKQVDEAVPLLVAQDKNPAFHKVVSGLKAVHPPRNPMGLRVQPANLTKPKQEAAPVQQGLSIMVFVSDNEASQHAVNLAAALARQDVDSVHVMHACTNEGTIPDAQKLMARFTQGLSSKINSEVMVRGTQSVVDCLLDYAAKHKAGLIVMGSQQMTKGDAALTSSITLAVLKRTDAPVVVTKPSTPVPLECMSRGMRAMLAVEHTARPLLKWLNTHLITVPRGDKLFLARVGAKDAKAQEDHTTKQMLEQFADLAGKKVHVEKRSLVGAQLEAFGAAVRQDDVHLLAIAVPHNQPVPQQAIDMLRTAKAAVLLMKCKPTA